MAILLLLLALVPPLVLLRLSTSRNRRLAIAASGIGLLAGLLLLAFAYSDTPPDSEPHLSSMYADLAKYVVRFYAWPLVLLFGVVFARKLRPARPPADEEAGPTAE